MLASIRNIRLKKCMSLSCSKTYCDGTSFKYPATDKEKKKLYSSIDDESKRQKEAKRKMTDLLQSLSKQSFATTEVKIFYPQPKAKKKSVTVKEMKMPEDDDAQLGFSMKAAVQDVAKTLQGDEQKIKSELLEALLSHSSSKQSLSDLLSQMTVVKTNNQFLDMPSEAKFNSGQDESGRPRAKFPKYRPEDSKSLIGFRQKTTDIFGAPPLGIFLASFEPSKDSNESILPTWNRVSHRDMQMSVSPQPRNYFEEMIKWTEQGKIWVFPIDNEIGEEEEKLMSFAEHIFVERHLGGWCPPTGPIRHFMELVTVGLSKNPYITVARKKAHIQWYKSYFENKTDLLKDIGAI